MCRTRTRWTRCAGRGRISRTSRGIWSSTLLEVRICVGIDAGLSVMRLLTEPAETRARSRRKLGLLLGVKFDELSTDVYDELLRRMGNEEGNARAYYFVPVSRPRCMCIEGAISSQPLLLIFPTRASSTPSAPAIVTRFRI